jgi:hypothetical protein
MKSQAQRRSRLVRIAAVTGTVALLGAAACAAQVQEKPKDDDVTVQEITAKKGRHFKRPVQVVIEAVRAHAGLTMEQEQTLDAIAAELEEERGTHRQLREKFRSSAVAIVRSGTTDSAEFDRTVDEAMSAFEKRARQNADALEEIHAILDADQRSAVAAALRTQIDEKLGRGDRDHRRHRDGFKRFASHLMLSKLQMDKLETLKKELVGEKQRLRPTREELHALVDAFESDDFRTALNDFQAKKLAILRERIADAGERTDSALAILTPEQRVLLADLIQDGWRKVLHQPEKTETASR